MNDIQRERIEKIEIELLLEAIYRQYGYDFRNYSFSSIKRRIMFSLHEAKAHSISEFQGKVLYEPLLMKKLVRNISINVTEMFRDPQFFLSFRENVVPQIRNNSSINLWIAGCSSGEEVYSLAILLLEEKLYEKSTIFATDMNEDIIEAAKKGIVPLLNMKKYTKNYIEAGGQTEFSKYYTVNGDYAILDPLLKKNVTFALHNLVTDHSFNEFDVIFCRNVLIYFNKKLKTRVLQLFCDSLKNDGFLGLGYQETLTTTPVFIDFDTENKLYIKQ